LVYKNIEKKYHQAGLGQIMWDGKNALGGNVASGVYIFSSFLIQDNGEYVYRNSQKGVLLK